MCPPWFGRCGKKVSFGTVILGSGGKSNLEKNILLRNKITIFRLKMPCNLEGSVAFLTSVPVIWKKSLQNWKQVFEIRQCLKILGKDSLKNKYKYPTPQIQYLATPSATSSSQSIRRSSLGWLFIEQKGRFDDCTKYCFEKGILFWTLQEVNSLGKQKY